MKKLSLKPLLLSAVIILSIVSCKKNNDTPMPPDNKDGELLADFFKNNGPKFESFTVDAATGGTVTTTKGTKFTIPANVFIKANGQAITGSVVVAVKEILGASDMLLGDKPTLTQDGQMLISFGEFYIRASQNNNDLVLKQDSAIGVQVPAKAANGRQEVPMWAGDSVITTTQSGYDHENNPVTISSQIAVNKGVTWEQNGSYAFFNPSNSTLNFRMDSLMQWVNCDALAGDAGPKTTVMGYFSDHYNNETSNQYSGEQPTMLFFKPQGRNTLIKYYNVIMNAPAGKEGLHSYQTSMPVGLPGSFLAISTKDGKFYAEMKDVSISAPSGSNTYSSVTFDPQEVSQSDLLNLITQLNNK
jgi:hypothetical protein